ncbi:MAG TPA: TonB-dependent receptor [Candidatus Kapabacteria bacterium]|nr:TonB-dependent receptor [Candidatus Kapabacteria bacterium]
MKLKKYLLLILLIGCSVVMAWSQNNEIIITHDEIIRSGARTLADVLARVPGIRISFNTSQSTPSSGPLVSSDSPTQLSSDQFSRVLILFNGHALNKNWYGGADHEWGTGFLEGLKEIHIYTGPAAMSKSGTNGGNGGTSAMDMVIDLIPLTGTDQNGAVDIRLSQSINEDRLDRTLLHLSTGNKWGQDGDYSVFADVTRWLGEDIGESCDLVEPGSRLDRKNPTFQVGGIVKKGPYNFMARHLEHYLFDPCYCGRKWSYTFAEAARTFEFPARWHMQVTAGADRIVSKWGAASSALGEATGPWDKVTEFRILLRAELSREFKTTGVFFGVDFQNIDIDGGAAQSNDYFSVMNFSTTQTRLGANLRLRQDLFGSWKLKGALRVEKTEGYSGVYFLPELSLLYKKGGTDFGISYAAGHRYMDTWYRVGSGNYNPNNPVPMTPYIIPIELKPELNRQLRAWVNQELSGPWTIYAAAFIGKYSHLMGIDWDYALEHQFNQLRAIEVGSYSYWGGIGSLFYRGTQLTIGGNISFQGTFDAQLAERQLYLDLEGKRPLYLAPVTANIFLDWNLTQRITFSGRYFISGSARNGGIDLTTANFETIYNTKQFIDTSSYSMLDISFRLLNIWKKFELQLTAHNLLDKHARLPIVEGGTFLTRGREITLTLRRQF